MSLFNCAVFKTEFSLGFSNAYVIFWTHVVVIELCCRSWTKVSLLNYKKENGWKSTDCCEPAICVVSKRDISLHNIQRNIWKIQDGGCWHVRFVAFVTILLNRPHRSRRFIYFKALFSCKKHQGKIYKTQRVLVANLATNFWILVASTIILVALATVLGAISCPVL